LPGDFCYLVTSLLFRKMTTQEIEEALKIRPIPASASDVALATAEVRQLLATGTAELIRRRAGLSFGAVARALDVTPATVLKWERSEFFPSGERAVRYAALLRELRETTDTARRVRA
jgi:DNA-binding transcriptional regulator YiaG